MIRRPPQCRATAPPVNILTVMEDPALFARWFSGDSWAAWRVLLRALFAIAMTEAEQIIFGQHTGRTVALQDPAREAWLAIGRRGGKSLVAAFVAVFLACFRDWSPYLAPGEVATVMVIAPDKKQARVIMRYVGGFFDNIGMLSGLIKRRTKESIELTNCVVIEVHVCSFRLVRGYSIIAAICDEIAFWRSEESANPDVEILRALRPALSTIPGSLLLCISSPYARRGALWQAYKSHFGKDGDPVLVWQSDTRSMNTTVDGKIVEQAYQEDESSASAEYGGLFRTDVESFVSREAVDGCVVPGRLELPYPASGIACLLMWLAEAVAIPTRQQSHI